MIFIEGCGVKLKFDNKNSKHQHFVMKTAFLPAVFVSFRRVFWLIFCWVFVAELKNSSECLLF